MHAHMHAPCCTCNTATQAAQQQGAAAPTSEQVAAVSHQACLAARRAALVARCAQPHTARDAQPQRRAIHHGRWRLCTAAAARGRACSSGPEQAAARAACCQQLLRVLLGRCPSGCCELQQVNTRQAALQLKGFNAWRAPARGLRLWWQHRAAAVLAAANAEHASPAGSALQASTATAQQLQHMRTCRHADTPVCWRCVTAQQWGWWLLRSHAG